MAKAVSEGEGIVETILNLHFNIFFIGKIPGEEMATQSSILTWKNSIDRGAWQAVVHGVTSERTHTHKLFIGHGAKGGAQHEGPCREVRSMRDPVCQ